MPEEKSTERKWKYELYSASWAYQVPPEQMENLEERLRRDEIFLRYMAYQRIAGLGPDEAMQLIYLKILSERRDVAVMHPPATLEG